MNVFTGRYLTLTNHTNHTTTPSDVVRATVLTLAVALLFFSAGASGQTVAFPGAEGFGKYTTGGRGGRVIEVTSTEDMGTGTLRAAVNATGTRTIVFRVSGTIKLLSTLRIRNGNVTIAGQTAPGGGICIRDYPVRIETDNVILRFLRFRLGDSTKLADDAISGTGDLSRIFRNIIIDHCSMSWAIDEDASFYDNANFTVQWSYITESLYASVHPKGFHGYGGIWGGWKVSFHHNLFAHNSSRNPRFNGSRYTLQPDSEIVDFRNNVLYNWGFNSIYGGEAGNQNVVANYYKYGPATNSGVRSRIAAPEDTAGNWYVADNFVFGNSSITADNWNGGIQGSYATLQRNKRALTPFPSADFPTQTAEEAYELVLRHGGASLPLRDAVDARIVDEVRSGTAHFGGIWGIAKGIIDSQDSVGGWPLLATLPPPADGDHDGMPDAWEISASLNPADSSDGAIVAPDGFTNLEHYMNELAAGWPVPVREENPDLPAGFGLKGTYPNPFNPATTVTYEIPEAAEMQLDVCDLQGKTVALLVDSWMPAGNHTATFSASGQSSGVYFLRLRSGRHMDVRKMLLLK
jgi:hypothetical protein